MGCVNEMATIGKARAALDQVRAIHDLKTSEAGNRAATLRPLVQQSANQPLRHQQRSHERGGNVRGNADMSEYVPGSDIGLEFE